MDKIYDQKSVEEKWYRFWEESGYFKANPQSGKKPYSLLMPPPNVTGALHLGHAMQHSILDAIARFKRMQGYDVLLLPGVDHAGIQFEGTLNKLLEKKGLSKHKLGREEWLKRAWEFKKESYDSVSATWRVMGLSADWEREVFTLDPKMAQAVFHEFKTFWEQNLLYKGAYIVQWCPKDQTAIEDVEMEYEERKEKLYYVKYQIATSGSSTGDIRKPGGLLNDYIVVATARPETIFADSGIAIYPEHPDFKKYEGMNATNPLTGQSIPIFSDKRVKKDFGSGALKITPGHDPLDYEIGKDHNLPIRHAIDKTGRMTTIAGKFAGLKVVEARDQIGNELSYLNALGWKDKKTGIERSAEQYTHSVPVCERCKATIEPLISEEWFVNMKPLAAKALKRIGEVNFVPKNYQKILSDWIKNIHDWCISRPLWWGYRIPVWYCQKCNPTHLVGKDRDMVISMEHPKQNCQTCSLNEWVQDEQLLDTWFSSGIWPMATLGYPEKTKEFEKYFPWDFEISAPEIKYLWIARMIMLSLHFTDKIPFKDMFFHGMIRDLQGRKFSKSLGNGIDPNELRVQWGTDAVRMALFSYSAPGRDGRANRQTMDERCKNYRNFGTKLWNIGRFISIESSVVSHQTSDIQNTEDKKIIEELNKTIKEVTKNIESFNLHLATETLYEFVWHEFADKYIESTKERRIEAQPVLEYVFKTCLELLHPFMPFITEELWQKMPHEPASPDVSQGGGKSIILARWPK